MNKYWQYGLLLMALTGCAHESTITPSQGHIGSGQETQTATAAPASDIPKPVKKPAYVPPPKPKTKEQTYSVVVSDVPVQEILFALARESKTNIDIHPAVQGKVTLNAVDQTLPAILERLSTQVDLRYKMEGNVLSIAPDTPTLRSYKIDYVNIVKRLDANLSVGKEVSSGGGTSSDTSDSTTAIKSNSDSDFWKVLTDNINAILKTTKTQVAADQETDALLNKADAATAQAILDQTNKDSGKRDKTAEKEVQDARDSVVKLKKERAGKTDNDVIVNALAGSITVMATERQHTFIRQYVDSVMLSVQRQVLIEATIVEVTLSNQFQQGIDWSRLGSNGANSTKSGFTFKQSLGGAALAAGNQFVFGYANTGSKLGDLAASLRLLETFGDTRVLSSPKIMALNNQAALLKVVDNKVYFKVTVTPGTLATSTTAGTLPVYSTSVEKVPVGVVLSVTPQINVNGNVSLNVRPTISRIIRFVKDPNPDLAKEKVENLVPEVQVREIESLLQVNSGQTVVLGGLMQDKVDNINDNVPGISNIPLLGKLFKSKDDTRTKTELVIFLRPTVIPNASLESDELKSFKQFLPDQLPVATTDEPAN